MKRLFSSFFLLTLIAAPALALDGFSTGPVFDDFGPVADVETSEQMPDDAQFKIAFDIKDMAGAGERNRKLESAARFINMHVREGVPRENIEIALVIHGGAVKDVATTAFRARTESGENGNTDMVAALIEEGVDIIVCGQSAAYYGVETQDLLPGVKMALSAMTSHALLQQQGYTLNPF